MIILYLFKRVENLEGCEMGVGACYYDTSMKRVIGNEVNSECM